MSGNEAVTAADGDSAQGSVRISADGSQNPEQRGGTLRPQKEKRWAAKCAKVGLAFTVLPVLIGLGLNAAQRVLDSDFMPWEGLLLPLYILPVAGIILLIQSAALAIDEWITRGRNGNIARFCVILGFVLLGSVVYLPLLAELIDAVSGQRDGMGSWMGLFAMFFVAPFSLLAFLYAFFAKASQREDERKRGR